MEKFKIESAAVEDFDEILRMKESLWKWRKKNFSEVSKNFHKREREKTFLVDEKKIYLVAKNNKEEIVAFISGGIFERDKYYLKKIAALENLFVKESYRHLGIGKDLFCALEKEFKALGCEGIICKTDFENENSRKLYESAGMNSVMIEYFKQI